MRKSLAASLLALAVAAVPASAAILTVDITDDELDGPCVAGDCSLREALADAAVDDEIQFALPGPPPWTITVLSGLGPLVVDQIVNVNGPGIDDLILSGNDNTRVLRIDVAASTVIRDLTIRDGRATSSSSKDGGCVVNTGDVLFIAVRFESCNAWDGALGFTNGRGGHGGAVVNLADAPLQVWQSEFLSNSAGTGDIGPGGDTAGPGGSGGAIANFGLLSVLQTTFDGNQAGLGGQPNGDGGEGGAIANLGAGTALIEESTFSGNRSGDGRAIAFPPFGTDGRGGALLLASEATLNNVTLSGNAIGSAGSGTANTGGGLQVTGGTTRLRNVTVAGNAANGAGGGIARSGGSLLVRNSLIALNSGAGANDDCVTNAAASLVSEDHNLVGVVDGCAASFVGAGDLTGTAAAPLDPVIGPLAANGGPTGTRALLAASPAIDAGEVPDCLGWNPILASDFALTSDQRGELRPVDGDGDMNAICDPGAYEAPEGTTVERLLTVALAGGGSGTVTSAPAGISCPGDCTELYPDGTLVTLTPTADPGSTFIGWSGDCTGSGACQVTMSVDRNVTATFELLFTLDVTVVGPGAVTSVPSGISCPGDCTEDYQDGTPVTLTATADPGALFTGWSGDCSGTGTCQLTMDQAHSVTATFVDLFLLEVTIPTGGGTVTSSPPGIDCPGDCSESYPDGTVVDLTATPSAGFQFLGWSGSCSGTGACQVTMNQNHTVTASFEATVVVWTLDVTVLGPGTGTVTSVPAGISCPSDCTEDYADGSLVTLAASPAGGSYFAGWSGDCSGTGTCDLTMDQAHAATATFDTMPFVDGFESGDTSAWSSSVP